MKEIMKTFKIGDTIKIKSNKCYHGIPICTIFTLSSEHKIIKDSYNRCMIIGLKPGSMVYVIFDDIELVRRIVLI